MKTWSDIAIGALLFAAIVGPFALLYWAPKEEQVTTIAYFEFMDLNIRTKRALICEEVQGRERNGWNS